MCARNVEDMWAECDQRPKVRYCHRYTWHGAPLCASVHGRRGTLVLGGGRESIWLLQLMDLSVFLAAPPTPDSSGGVSWPTWLSLAELWGKGMQKCGLLALEIPQTVVGHARGEWLESYWSHSCGLRRSGEITWVEGSWKTTAMETGGPSRLVGRKGEGLGLRWCGSYRVWLPS